VAIALPVVPVAPAIMYVISVILQNRELISK